MKLIMGKLLIVFISISSAYASSNDVASSAQAKGTAQLAKLETTSGGRIGVYAIDTSNNISVKYRSYERFPFCSTGKVMVVAAILNKSMAESSLLQKQIKYNQKDIDKSGYAPVTKQHLATGMNINQLCVAAIEYSDNTAMNLLLDNLGGPQVVNAYASSIGDTSYSLNRREPELNTAIPGDLRDTTTPYAMANSLQTLVVGDKSVLAQRELLKTWLKANTTGDKRIRAGVPKNWTVGDKTGTGSYGTTNDIAVIWPEKCAPIVLAIYYTQNQKSATPRDEVIAAATKIAINELAKTNQCLN